MKWNYFKQFLKLAARYLLPNFNRFIKFMKLRPRKIKWALQALTIQIPTFCWEVELLWNAYQDDKNDCAYWERK